jgi:hypothetical protein
MDIIFKIRLMLEKGKWGSVTHPGILEVPEGSSVMDLGYEHFEDLAKSKGLGAIVKALLNLERWNSKSNPKLSSWARGMINQLHSKFKAK